jgi:hypothetical protein
VTFTGKTLVIALLAATLVGVVAGSFASGWRKARGLPPMECTTDAGVQLQVDAGVREEQHCTAAVEHWTVVHVPGPIRYVSEPDGGVLKQPEVVTVLVPELRLGATQALRSDIEAQAEAHVTATEKVAPAAPERFWEVGPAVLVDTKNGSLLFGAATGVNLGPFGARVTVVGNTAGLYAGGALVWRF